MGKDNKRKWEIEYESLKKKNIAEEIKKLEGEINNAKRNLAAIKDDKSNEYRAGKMEQKIKKEELNKMKMLKENLPKVEKILKKRESQVKRLKKLESDKKTYEASLQETKRLSDEAKKLDEELTKLKEQEAKINEALKDPNLTDEKRKILVEARNKNQQARSENNDKFSKNQKALTEKLNNPLPKKDFDKEIEAANDEIRMYNFICRKLMEGKKADDITADLKNWKGRRLTDKTNDIKNKMENSNPEVANSENDVKNPVPVSGVDKSDEPVSINADERTGKPVPVSGVDKSDEPVSINANEGTDKLVSVSEFDEKHPRLAKIKNFFKHPIKTVKEGFRNIFGKEEIGESANNIIINDEETRESLVTENTTKKDEPQGKLSAEQIADKKAEFYKRLAQTGNFSQLPTDGKLPKAIKKQERIVKKLNKDEGR